MFPARGNESRFDTYSAGPGEQHVDALLPNRNSGKLGADRTGGEI
jgi:hypothetical protein